MMQALPWARFERRRDAALDPDRESAITARLGEPSAHLYKRLADRVQRDNKNLSTRLSTLRRRLRNRPTGRAGRGRAT